MDMPVVNEWTYICNLSRERLDFPGNVVEEGACHSRLCCETSLRLVAKHVLNKSDTVIVNASQQRLEPGPRVNWRKGALSRYKHKTM